MVVKSSNPQPLPLAGTPIRNPHTSDEERMDVIKQWAHSFIGIRERLRGTIRREIDHTIKYLEECSGFAVPVVNEENQWGLIRSAYSGDSTRFYIAALVKSDAELSPYFANRIRKGSYVEWEQTIYLPAEKLSSNWQALTLYHELLHSAYDPEKRHRSKEGCWIEEYEVYIKEIKLARELYGKPYSYIVYRLSKGYERQLRTGKLSPLKDREEVTLKQLEKVYGHTNSSYEREIQQALMELDAIFLALDRIHVNGDKKEHYALMKWFYGKGETQTLDKAA